MKILIKRIENEDIQELYIAFKNVDWEKPTSVFEKYFEEDKIIKELCT